MLLQSIVTVLNTVAIITIVTTLFKCSKSFRAESATNVNARRNFDYRISDVTRSVGILSEEVKKLRIDTSGSTEREAMSEKMYSGYGGSIQFAGNIVMQEEYLNNVAEIAVKTIMSELPKEKRTLDVINDVIARAKKCAANKEIKL